MLFRFSFLVRIRTFVTSNKFPSLQEIDKDFRTSSKNDKRIRFLDFQKHDFFEKHKLSGKMEEVQLAVSTVLRVSLC